MKKILLFVLVSASLITISCKSGPSSSDPKATLISFFKALSNKDFKTAREYATKESESMFSIMEMAMNMAGTTKSPEIDEQFKKFQDTQIGEPIIEGEKATVPVTSKGMDEGANFILKKENGVWKVAFDMQSMREMGMDKARRDGREPGMSNHNVNLDSLTQAIKNINTDSLQKVMKESIGTLDSLQEALKALKH